jgi:membrane-associated phospholipid phosphatase
MGIVCCNLADLDINILRAIHHHRIVALDQALYYVSYISTYISIGLVLSVLITSIIKKSKPLRLIFYKMLAVLVIAALTSFLLKNAIIRERPFVTYPDIEKLSEAGSSSFPSGHTLESFAIAVAFSFAFPKKKFIVPLFLWACLIAYSRMALGVHYPGDVLGGIIIGSLIGYFVPGLIHTKQVEPL